MTAFLTRDADWAAANEEIMARRNVSTKARDSVTEALEKSVRHEINFVYSIWGYEFERAFQAAVAATEALSGGKELKPYRAFWHYTAAIAAYYEWVQSGDEQWRDRYRGEIGRSLATSMGVTWLPGLQTAAAGGDSSASSGPSVNIVEVSELLEEWQIVGTKFERALNGVRDAINSDEASKFERGLKSLGRMLGCTSRSFDDDGAPDGLWILADNKAIVFEAKTDENPAHPISLKTVRQAATHARWVIRKGEISEETEIVTVLVTHQSEINRDAHLLAADIRIVSVDEMKELFARAATLLNSIRASARSLVEEQLRDLIDEKFRAASLTHSELLRLLTHRPLSAIQIRG